MADPVDSETRLKIDGKLEEMATEVEEVRKWIEAVTELEMEGTFDEWLRSGVILCEVLNKIKPGVIRKINKGKMPFVQMENISNFLKVIKAMGVKESDCFDTVDLYRGADVAKVIQTIYAFGSHLQFAFPSYKGPQLGVKVARKNVRTFTETQLAASRNEPSKMNQGSSTTMQRSEVSKQGITFGNDASTRTAPYPSQ